MSARRARRTDTQRLLAGRLPVARPAVLTDREWALLVAHVRDGVPLGALAQREGVNDKRLGRIVARAL